MTLKPQTAAAGLATLLLASGAGFLSLLRVPDPRKSPDAPQGSVPPATESVPRADEAETDDQKPSLSRGAKAMSPSVQPAHGWTVSGRVLKQDGLPAADVEVRLKEDARTRKTEAPFAEPMVRTNAAGRFVVPGVPGGKPLHLEIDEPRSALLVFSVELRQAKREETLHLGDLTLEPPHSMRLKIVGPDGLPVAEAWVLADRTRFSEEKAPARGGSPEIRREIPDAGNGEYILNRVPAGRWRLYVVTEGFAYRPNQPVHVDLPQREPLLLALDAGAWLIGSVCSADGKPIPDAEVDAIDSVEGQNYQGVKTDTKGRFEMGFLIPGSYWVTVSAPGFALQRLEKVPTGTSGVDFTLVREAVFSGRVVAKNGGRPIRGATVFLRSANGVIRGVYRRQTRTDSRGRFAIDKVHPGTFLASVQHDDFIPTGEIFSVELEEGQRVKDVIIHLRRGLQAAGRIVDSATGEPVAAARVHFHYRNPNRVESELHSDDRRSATTGPDGSFLLKVLPEGEHEVSWEADGYVRRRGESVSVTGRSIEGLVLTLDREENQPGAVQQR